MNEQILNKLKNINIKYSNTIIFTALPYVNYYQHFGHLISTHIPAFFFKKLLLSINNKAYLIGGSDCHGSVLQLESMLQNKKCDDIVNFFHDNAFKIFEYLNIEYDYYGLTTKEYHKKNALKIFFKLLDLKYIVRKRNKVFFCKTHNLFLNDRFLACICNKCFNINRVNEICIKCNYKLRSENIKNYLCILCKDTPIQKTVYDFFFNFYKFKDQILKWNKEQINLYNNNLLKNIILFLEKSKEENMIKCVSRNIKWGININKSKSIYVWFEALLGYLSFYNFFLKDNILKHNKNITFINFIGKDNLFFHNVLYIGMLLSIKHKLPLTVKTSFFLNYNKRKFSKSQKRGIFFNFLSDKKIIKILKENNFNVETFNLSLFILYPETKDINFSFDKYFNIHNNIILNKICNIYYRISNILKKHCVFLINNSININNIDMNKYVILDNFFIEILDDIEFIRINKLTKNTINFFSILNKYIDNNKLWNLKSQYDIFYVFYYLLLITSLIKTMIPEIINNILLNNFNIKDLNINLLLNYNNVIKVFNKTLLFYKGNNIKNIFYIKKINNINKNNIKRAFDKN